MPHAIHRVTRFDIVGPYTLVLEFDDGSRQRIDFRPGQPANGADAPLTPLGARLICSRYSDLSEWCTGLQLQC